MLDINYSKINYYFQNNSKNISFIGNTRKIRMKNTEMSNFI